MKHVSEYRDPEAARMLSSRIHALARQCAPVTFMEVCGTHTMAIYRHGIRQLLPASVRLLSGPGCPVCVTPNSYVDRAIALSREPHITIATFGDMLRVPGSTSSLQRERARGGDIRLVYSTLDALDIARQEPKRQVVFLGVGFETTAPTVAAAIAEAHRSGVSNFTVLAAGKTIFPAMRALVTGPELQLDGFLCPGHVTMVTGTAPYEFLARDHHVPCVVAGFEPLDVLQAILMLLQQRLEQRAQVEVAYRRVVRQEGNPSALAMMNQVFEPVQSEWRGMGMLADSGLGIRRSFAPYDAMKFEVPVEPTRHQPACACGDILRGLQSPFDCPLFARACTPESPQGACMVSSEGTCAAAFRYGRHEGP